MKKKISDKKIEKTAYHLFIQDAAILRAEWQNKKTTYGQQPFTVR